MNPETEKVIADLKEHYGIDVAYIVKKDCFLHPWQRNGWSESAILIRQRMKSVTKKTGNPMPKSKVN